MGRYPGKCDKEATGGVGVGEGEGEGVGEGAGSRAGGNSNWWGGGWEGVI
jgi:hypothetical protein